MKRYFLVILFGFFIKLISAQIFNVDTIQYTGPIDNRINLIILGDGYQSSELSKFIIDANNFSSAFFSEKPYYEYRDYFNVFAIKTPSNQSGASHPRTGSDQHDIDGYHPLLVVDNYFGSTFDYNGIHRLLFPRTTATITNVLANNFPSYDQVIILVNSPYYGGSGGEFATISTSEGTNFFINGSANELALHELGHSFSDLADEYYAGDNWAAEKVNMTQESDPTNVKWKNWLYDYGIGIYQHIDYSSGYKNWYRPHENCKMRRLGVPFCSVCVEGIIEKIHLFVSPIDLFSPINDEKLSILLPTEFILKLNKPNPNTLKIEWYLNASIINRNDESILIDPNNLIHGVNQLQAVVEDDSALLRVDNHETIHIYSVLWTIESSTLSIVDVSEEHLKIELFPNPTNNILNVNLNGELGDEILITLYNLTGIELLKKRVVQKSEPIVLDLKPFTTGVYIIKLQLNNGHIISRKIIKE